MDITKRCYTRFDNVGPSDLMSFAFIDITLLFNDGSMKKYTNLSPSGAFALSSQAKCLISIHNLKKSGYIYFIK